MIHFVANFERIQLKHKLFRKWVKRKQKRFISYRKDIKKCSKMPHPGKTELIEIDATIAKLFEAISFEKGSEPNMPKIKDLFVEEGLLINYNEENPQIFRIAEFIDHFASLFKQGVLTSLEDREVYHKTKIYDRIAHRYSFYEARTSADETPFAVGINSIQLIRLDTGWKVTSMAWNDDIRGDGFFQRTIDCVRSNQ